MHMRGRKQVDLPKPRQNKMPQSSARPCKNAWAAHVWLHARASQAAPTNQGSAIAGFEDASALSAPLRALLGKAMG
jgi:hypothetical protein